MDESIVVVGEAGKGEGEGENGVDEGERQHHQVCGRESQEVCVWRGSPHGLAGENCEVDGVADDTEQTHGRNDVLVEHGLPLVVVACGACGSGGGGGGVVEVDGIEECGVSIAVVVKVMGMVVEMMVVEIMVVKLLVFKVVVVKVVVVKMVVVKMVVVKEVVVLQKEIDWFSGLQTLSRPLDSWNVDDHVNWSEEKGKNRRKCMVKKLKKIW